MAQKRHRLSHYELVGSFQEGGGESTTYRTRGTVGQNPLPTSLQLNLVQHIHELCFSDKCGGSKALPRMCDVVVPGTDLAYNCLSGNRCVVSS